MNHDRDASSRACGLTRCESMPDVGSGVGPARLMVCKSVTQQVDVCLLGAAWRHLTTIRLNHFHERDV